MAVAVVSIVGLLVIRSRGYVDQGGVGTTSTRTRAVTDAR